ncbi:Eco57I restriction-modification methylase [Desulfurobacterium pacificum]|uniref:site-specific DNA-methyltransferase (adenine-specific) n=1 Tax=Desulfurobacterium pacificum TaxID=240166 RepID=A0ABY1N764_9BACT|nr:DNA methyltransferase [Desulfurobacterium pacificum]SMP02257.1 Eco57I restriction-modification methylase [Desulfurobacterium pacificum]
MENIVKTLIENPFDKSNFETFLKTVFESADFEERFEIANLENYPERFKETIKKAEIFGTYEDEENNRILFITVELNKETTLERARKTQRDFVARIIDEYNAEAAIVAFYVPDSENWRLSFVFKTYTFDKSGILKEVSTTPKRFSLLLGKGEASKTALNQLLKLGKTPNPTIEKVLETFSVEKINDEFFRRYLLYFKTLWRIIYNQIKDKTEKSEKKSKETAHQLLNRLTFVYFIQKKKKWFNSLKEESLIDFLVREYKSYIAQNPEKEGTFYSEWIKPLFFSAFNGKRGEINSKYRYLPENVRKVLLETPYLNGGLFEENDLDRLSFSIPDEFFLEEDPYNKEKEGVIPFLNSYNFTIIEDLEDDRDVAVNPEFIGTVYEKLVHIDSASALQNPEKEIDTEGILKGIVYTKEPEIRFMVTQSLIYYLKNNTNLPDETIYNFIFDDDFKPADRNVFDTLKRALDELKVVDPACGSGAFLVGMVDTLYKLYQKLYRFDPEVKESNYAIRKRIIENNVYGVDVMEWAVRIAELRLWLFLIVETELSREEVLIKPLLPNLSFKLRAGDSLIEEFGGIDFSILRAKRQELKSKFSIPKRLKDKISRLKNKKLKYARNETDAPKRWEIEQEEFNLFKEIVEEKIREIRKNIDSEKLRKPSFEKDLFGKTLQKELELFEKQRIEKIKQYEKELNLWKQAENALRKGKRPFIWDIDFVEVFYGDKSGFDIVIGNPPYVRQEKIAPPDKNEEDYKPSEWRKLKKEYKEKLQNMVVNLYGKEYKPDGKADLYVYFYFKALSLLNEKGTLAFITSNSWLDVGFGKSLQEFFLKRTKIYSINDNQSKRSFKEADVNTVIVFSSAPTDKAKEKENLENTAKFVMWKIPFDEAVNSHSFKEYLQFIDNVKLKVENKDLTELAENVISKDAFRVFPVKQKDLLNDGTKDGKYEGNKWGGKFLRAPDIFFTILKKGKGKLVRLGDIAEIRFGIKTGANEFFYVEDLTDKLSNRELEKVENLRGFTSVEEIKRAGLRIAKPSKWGKNTKDYKLFLIEREFLKPIIKSPRELKTIIVREEDLKYRVFMCNKTKKELKGTFALDYIKWGEEQGFHKRPTCRSRREWWQLGKRRISDFIIPAGFNDSFKVVKNEEFLVDKRLYEIYASSKKENLVISFNHPIFFLSLEILSRQGLGEGLLDLTVYEVEMSFIVIPQILPPNTCIRIIDVIKNRPIHSIFTELGFDPNKPIKEQEPKPLPDRKALDDIVFDALDLTREERKEVYYAVAELVQNRLKKARSV